MNPTQNVRCIEADEDIFNRLCEFRYDETVEQIRRRYLQLKGMVSQNTDRWMKIRETDCYLDTKNKVLIPDTRKMLSTDLDLDVYSSDFYDDIVKYTKTCGKDELNAIEKRAKEKGLLVPSAFEEEIVGLPAYAMSGALAQVVFSDRSCPFQDEEGWLLTQNGKECFILTQNLPKPICDIVNTYFYGCRSFDHALKISVHKFPDTLSVFEMIVKYELYPECFSDEVITLLKSFHEMTKHDVNPEDPIELRRHFKENKIEKFLDYDLRMDAIKNDVQAEEIDLTSEAGIGKVLRDYYDGCDHIRGRIQKYSTKWYLSDEGRGHWELWGEPKVPSDTERADTSEEEALDTGISAKKKVLRLKHGVIARNPVADVRHDAVVGIDFGTKSTIVALQDGDDRIIPLRVGMADYSIAPKSSHFENPTVMQFEDLSHFMKQYHKSSGRPLTSWDDLKISHEAFANLIGSEESEKIASFATNLKQWAAGKYGNRTSDGHLIIKDGKGYRYDIDAYLELTEEDIDLIELYAYYIGLFINNMHTGIYLDYLMSFPETFSIEIRNRILESFTRGIRKSIPTAVLADPICGAEFRVRQGPSEPAAYAACALEQYGIEPTDNGIFYGIFDFGGGTTDYDYGIWKNAAEEEYTYNYVIRHYGSGGDKTLGGENILQLLAYEIFSDDNRYDCEESNLEIMRKNKLTYYRPDDGNVYSGTEALNNNGESARLNTKQMMEILRPIWEEWPEVREWLASGRNKTGIEIKVSRNASLLLEGNSSVKAALSLFSDINRIAVVLKIDMAMVNRIINDRIESGVRNFFEGLRHAYDKWDKKSSHKIQLFLAGNSSKSKRVMRLFLEYILKYNLLMFGESIQEETTQGKEDSGEGTTQTVKTDGTGSISGIWGNIFSIMKIGMEKETEIAGELNRVNELDKTRFVLYPPLGTEAAREFQKQHGILAEENDLMAPTGKTGVAFGLVMCREGSMLKIESETKKSEQIKLNYYIGINYRKNFKTIFDRSAEYNKWLKFSKVTTETETFEFYYSELPEVAEDTIPLRDNKAIHKHKCLLDHVSMDAYIFFRFVSPTSLEYVAALEDKVEAGEYMSKVYTVRL